MRLLVFCRSTYLRIEYGKVGRDRPIVEHVDAAIPSAHRRMQLAVYHKYRLDIIVVHTAGRILTEIYSGYAQRELEITVPIEHVYR